MINFVGLSAVLTGFTAKTIAPKIDPINIKIEYYAKFQTEIGTNLFTQILSDFQTLNIPPEIGQTQEERNQLIGKDMLAYSKGSAYIMACRKLIFLWYSGAWPSIIPATDCTPESTSSILLSSKSYTSGLVWQVMQSHPMGDSNYRYGYWANEPADLNEYTGNTN
ncbi:MAG: hypothetical protein JKY02_10285 [Flavobacteriaceae bacterium]|nr:hypothetical protein [Flavobacteriaceae bacterium]